MDGESTLMPSHEAEALAETLHTLTGLARGRFGKLEVERIARHVVDVTPGADWPVRKAALEALARLSLAPTRSERGVGARRALGARAKDPRFGFVRGAPTKQALGEASARLAWIEELERALAKGKLEAEPSIRTLLTEERARAARRAACDARA